MLQSIWRMRRSVARTWLLSYLAILLVPVLISIFVYLVSSRTLDNEIRRADGALLNQVREQMDNSFQAMVRLNFEMTWNVNVQQLLFSNKYKSIPQDYEYDLYQVSKDFHQYEGAYSPVTLFYLYVNENNKVIRPLSVRDAGYAYANLHKDNTFTYDKWQSIMNRTDVRGFVPMVRISEDGKTYKTVAYVSSYPSDTGKPIATNVIMIDQAQIIDTISNVELFSKGHVFILNGQNELLVSTSDSSLVKELPLQDMTSSGGLRQTKLNGQSYEVQYMRSPRSGLTYVSVIPKSVYWQHAVLVRNLTVASMLFSLLAGFFLTTLFLRRNYNPLRSLLQAFSGKSGEAFADGKNEFQFLQQAVDRTFSQMDSILMKMEQQRHVLRSNFIARLLKGRPDKEIPLVESLATFHMTFPSHDFAVILMVVEAGGAFGDRMKSVDPADIRKLMQFVVTNIMEEMAAERNVGYVGEVDDVFACLISFRQTSEEERAEELKRIARDTQQYLINHYQLPLTLSISGIHQGVKGISQAYAEALDAMEYKLVMGAMEILSYDDIHRKSGERSGFGFDYPLQAEQRLMNFMKVGDFDGARELLDEIIEANFGKPAVSIALARCLMLNLVSTMIKAVGEIGSVQESFLVQNPKQIEQLTSCQTVREMRLRMTEFLATVCEYTAVKRQQSLQITRKQSLNNLTEQIRELIQERYADPDLNISTIGHHFGMKPTYLSKLYKETTGEGLLDAINKTRIDKAKELLAEEHRSVGEAAEAVGYHDINAFIRIFKKYEGITPGKFKEMCVSA